ncbi:MAG: energy transducer TonB [Litorimonas sp.]
MKRMLIAIGLALALGTSVQAKTPKEVVEPYKAYRAALAANDTKAALKYSKAAWEAAEEHLGDHKTTGDLAQNYADVYAGDEVSKSQIQAMQRAMNLSSLYDEEADKMYLQRGVKLLQFYTTNGQTGKTGKLSNKLIDFSKDKDLDRSVFYGEVLTLKAGSIVNSRNGRRMIKYTDEALEVFERPSEIYESAYPIFAHLYNGFGHEYEGNVLEAALSYQKVMEYVRTLDYETHPIVGRALGRWIHMRGRLLETEEFEEAKEAGLCDCWPYDIERNESVQPIKRVPPRFPVQALRSSVSGYTIVQFDLDDAGNTINQKKIVSWPPDLYEEAALKSLEKWKYSPRVDGETDEDRKNLISTIRFKITDNFGNPVY